MKTLVFEIELDDYPEIGNGELHVLISKAIKSAVPSLQVNKSTLRWVTPKGNVQMVDADEYFGKKLIAY